MTQPDVYIGFTPTLGAGHGNHQQAGRFIWEGMLAAANPAMFPDQLTGPHALSTWQVKKIFSGGSTAGTGGTTTAADCTTGFIPTPGTNLDTVVGAWTGYDSPYLWPAGNVQGKPAGTPKIWAQVASEGSSAYPTQSRVMFQGIGEPGLLALRPDDGVRPVPAEHEPRRHGEPARRQGQRDPLRRDRAGSGRAAARHARVPDVQPLLQRRGQSFTATLHLTAPAGGAIPAGTVALTVPTGWTVDAAKPIGADRGGRHGDRRLHRHAERVGGDEQLQDLGALHGRRDHGLHGQRRARSCRRSRDASIAGASGREFDQWLNNTGPAGAAARPLRRGAVDGHRRDDLAPGRRPQLVDRRRRAAR